MVYAICYQPTSLKKKLAIPQVSTEDSRTVVDLLRNSKVRNLDTTLIIHEDVGPFDVTVDNVAFVKIVETLKDLPDEVLDKRFLKGTIIGKQTRNGTSRNVFQKNVEELVIERGIYMRRYNSGKGVSCATTYKDTARYSRALDS